MKTSSLALAALFCILGQVSSAVQASDVKPTPIATLYQTQAKLAGQTVSAHGKVVKVNNGILDRNWIHITDGSGDAKSSDLVVTSTQTAVVGDEVTITGVAALNRDFGAGYVYPLLIENATVTVKK